MAKRKNNSGRVVKERWVFGGYDTSTKIGFIVFVPDRTKETLLELIKNHIKPGNEIHSDCWAAYVGIQDIDVEPRFIHKKVNHKENFVDPVILIVLITYNNTPNIKGIISVARCSDISFVFMASPREDNIRFIKSIIRPVSL